MSTQKYKVLILTDHSNHSSENSLYDLTNKMLLHPKTASIDIASRGNKLNARFFNADSADKLQVTPISDSLFFSKASHPLSQNLRSIRVNQYDLIWLRMPPPLDKSFLNFVEAIFPRAIIINKPSAIYETGSKEYLTNFSHLCPPMKVCETLDDIIAFKNQFPIVLKPAREYGGKGIVRINGNLVSRGNKDETFESFSNHFKSHPTKYIAVKYLKNVSAGDKRIIVVNGEIMGASLRLPPEDSWICNVAMGGTAQISEVDEYEEEIIRQINPNLTKNGILMYGLDTLVGDDGHRVLSEINTTSIGGLPQMAAYLNKPLVEKAIDLIWDYFEKNKK